MGEKCRPQTVVFSSDEGCWESPLQQQQGQSLQKLVNCGLRRHSWTSFDNQAFSWSQMDLNRSQEEVRAQDSSPETQMQAANRELRKYPTEQGPSSQCDRSFVHTIRSPPDGQRGWLVVTCAAFLTTLTAGLLPCYGILLSQSVDSSVLVLQRTHLWIWLAAAAFALHSLSYPVWIFLSYRLSSRKVAVLGSVFFSSIFLLSYVNASYIWNYSVLVMAGLGSSACCAASVSAVEEYFSSKLHVAKSLAVSGWALGLLLWPSVLDFTFRHGGARWSLFSVGAIGTLGVLASLQFRPAASYYQTYYVIQNKIVEDLSPSQQQATTPGSSKVMVALFVTIAAFVNAARTFVTLLLPKFCGLTGENVSTVFGVCGLAEIVGRLFGGWMLKHNFGPAFRCWLCACFLMGGSTIGVSFCSRLWTVMACMTILGSSWGLWTTLWLWTPNDFLGKEEIEFSQEVGLGLLQAALTVVAPFLKELSFWDEWINSSMLFACGVIIIMSFLVAVFVSVIFIYTNRNNVTDSLE